MKKSFLTLLFMCVLLITCDSIFAQSGSSVATKLSGVYTSFVRPVLIAWAVIQTAIGGIMAAPKMRKHDDESSDAMMGWFRMAVWPVGVLAVAELGNAFYN